MTMLRSDSGGSRERAGAALDLGPISREMRLVEEEILRSLSGASPALRDVALHVISAGGKRIRPAMGLSAYLVAGGREPEVVVPLAAAVEMIHSATLIHDDIIDGSGLRRGRPSAHRAYGLQAAIVTGDLLFSRAFGLCSRYGPEAIAIASEACGELAEAEMLQATPPDLMSEELCVSIAGRKTGSLMAAGMEVAAMAAGAGDEARARLRRFGYSVGTAFQLVDDCLDFSLDGSTGKPPGADVLAGRATLPLVHALSRAPERERELLKALLSPLRGARGSGGGGEARPGERGQLPPAPCSLSMEGGRHLAELVELLERTGSLEYARARAEALCSAAREELRPFRSSVHRSTLEDITRFVVERVS
ncbi:MAG: polyprenyl synthetase family protein [Thermoplasmatota archaeon]